MPLEQVTVVQHSTAQHRLLACFLDPRAATEPLSEALVPFPRQPSIIGFPLWFQGNRRLSAFKCAEVLREMSRGSFRYRKWLPLERNQVSYKCILNAFEKARTRPDRYLWDDRREGS